MDPNYDGQEEDEEDEEDEEQAMSEGGEIVDEDLVGHEWGEPTPIHVTRSQSAAVVGTSIFSHGEASTSSMHPTHGEAIFT